MVSITLVLKTFIKSLLITKSSDFFQLYSRRILKFLLTSLERWHFPTVGSCDGYFRQTRRYSPVNACNNKYSHLRAWTYHHHHHHVAYALAGASLFPRFHANVHGHKLCAGLTTDPDSVVWGRSRRYAAMFDEDDNTVNHSIIAAFLLLCR